MSFPDWAENAEPGNKASFNDLTPLTVSEAGLYKCWRHAHYIGDFQVSIFPWPGHKETIIEYYCRGCGEGLEKIPATRITNHLKKLLK